MVNQNLKYTSILIVQRNKLNVSKALVTLITLCVTLFAQGCSTKNADTETHNAKSSSATKSKNSNNNYRPSNKHYKLVKKQNVLINGEIYPMCQDLLNNFNSFHEEPPMVCERKYNPDLGFSAPNWKPILEKNINWNILRQIYFSKHTSMSGEHNAKVLEERWNKEFDRLKELAKKKTILWEAEFNIDNKSGKENVIMLKDNDCSMEKYYEFNAPGPTLHVLNEEKNSLDKRYKRLDSYVADVFIYKNHTYLANWSGEKHTIGEWGIFINNTFMAQNRFGISNESICSYQYIK